MLYCKRCNRLSPGATCPGCGKGNCLRAPEADDPVLLCIVRMNHASMIEPLLREEGLAFSTATLGNSAIFGGSTFMENYAFYVSYAAHAQAREFLEGIFAQDEEVMRALREAAGETQGL